MCDACSIKNRNWSLHNGPGKSKLENVRLFSYFGSETGVRLCYLCSMQLFRLGESNFFQSNPALEKQIKQSNSVDSFDF